VLSDSDSEENEHISHHADPLRPNTTVNAIRALNDDTSYLERILMRPKNSTNQRLINIHRSREANEDRFTTFTYQAKQIKHIGKTYVGAKKPED